MKTACTVALLALTLFTGCSTTGSAFSSGKGVLVDLLEQPELTEWKQCGELSLVLVEVEASPDVSEEYNQLFLEKAKSKLSSTPYFTMREMLDKSARKGVTEFEAAHHFLKFRINTLNIQKLQGSFRVGNSIDLGITASLKKSSAESDINCGVKEFSDTYTYEASAGSKSSLPTLNSQVSGSMDKALDRLIRKISPKKKTVYRPLKSGMGPSSRIAELLDGENCELARDMAAEHVKNQPEDLDALYDLGVAYECLARQSKDQEAKIVNLRKARSVYAQYVMQDTSDQDALQAMKDVSTSLKLFAAAAEKQEKAMSKMKGGGGGGLDIQIQ